MANLEQSGRIACKTYIFIILQKLKIELKIFNTGLALLLFLKVLFLQKKKLIYCQKVLTSAKLRRPCYHGTIVRTGITRKKISY